jgi:hypothetical protein
MKIIKISLFVFAAYIIGMFVLAVSWAEEPRTLQDIQKDYAQWQSVYNTNNERYGTGVDITTRALANMKAAQAKMKELVDEAKALPKSEPESPVKNSEAPK